MKEASGELSMTAIAVVAIGAIAVLFGTLIFPNIRNSIQHNQRCTAAYGCHACSGGVCQCFYSDGSTENISITCDDPNEY